MKDAPRMLQGCSEILWMLWDALGCPVRRRQTNRDRDGDENQMKMEMRRGLGRKRIG